MIFVLDQKSNCVIQFTSVSKEPTSKNQLITT